MFSPESTVLILSDLVNIDINSIVDKSVALFIAVLVIIGLFLLYRNSLKRVETVTDAHTSQTSALNKQHDEAVALMRAKQFELALGFQKSISEQQQVLRDFERIMQESDRRAAERDNKIITTLEVIADRLTNLKQ